jgi:hypothetical protein
MWSFLKTTLAAKVRLAVEKCLLEEQTTNTKYVWYPRRPAVSKTEGQDLEWN